MGWVVVEHPKFQSVSHKDASKYENSVVFGDKHLLAAFNTLIFLFIPLHPPQPTRRNWDERSAKLNAYSCFVDSSLSSQFYAFVPLSFTLDIFFLMPYVHNLTNYKAPVL